MQTLPKLLVVARHAESVLNVAKAGQVFFADAEARRGFEDLADHDAGLTDTGAMQARALGELLGRDFGTFDVVYHSGYPRARDTAEAAVATMTPDPVSGPPVHEHVFLRERDPGYAFNMTKAEAETAFPWLPAYWRTVGPFFARPPGGESMADVAGRVQLFFGSCEQDLADRRVLLVTHVGTLRMIRYLLENWTHEEAPNRWLAEPVANASFVCYTATDGRLRPLAPHRAEA